MKFLNIIIFLSLSFVLSSCLDQLPEVGNDDFCPGARLSNGTCPSAFGTLSDKYWSFETPGDYTYNSNYVEISSGVASLKNVDQTLSGADLNSGTHVVTYVDANNNLTLRNKTIELLDVRNIFPDKKDFLVGYWRFDGDSIDSSNNGNHLTTISSGYSTDSKVGSQSGNFQDNSIAKINESSMMPTGKLTFTAWVKPTSANEGVRVIAGNYEAGGSPFTVLVRNNSGNSKWRVDLNQSSGVAISSVYGKNVIPLNTWSHLAVVADGTNVTLYVNGEYNDSEAYDGTILPVTTCWGIGARPRYAECSSYDQRFSGKIDEVSIWSESLTSEEVSTLYDTQVLNYIELSSSWTPEWDSIIGYWKMNGDWLDSSGKGNHGTPSGDATFTLESKVGSHAGTFDGAGDRVVISDSDDFDFVGNNFSYSGWFKADPTTTDTIGLWSYNSDDADYISIHIGSSTDDYANQLVMISRSGASYIQPESGVEVRDGGWHHFAITRDSVNQRMRLYLDGKMMDELVDTRTHDFVSVSDPIIGKARNNNKHYDGEIDEFVIWNVSLTTVDVQTIYNRQKQKYAGHYDSPVIDLGTSGNWSNIKTSSTLPFMKELPGNSINEVSADYSSLIANDGSSPASLSDGLMKDMVALWHFNGTEGDLADDEAILDSSGNGNNALAKDGDDPNSIAYSSSGRFAQSIRLDGVNDYVRVNSNMGITDYPFSFSLWVKLENSDSGSLMEFADSTRAGGNWTLRVVDGVYKIGARYDTNPSTLSDEGNQSVEVGKWTHLVGVFESATKRKIYVNGDFDAESVVNVPFYANHLSFGRLSDSTPGSYSKGSIDEAAVWSRTLNDNEIKQLYRRGGNRIKYQVRTCDDTLCDTEKFIGPDGTDETYFSELHNNDTIDGATGLATGVVLPSSLDITFSDFVTAPSNNRYFQYRVYMESDENTLCSNLFCAPELSLVEIGPTGRYYGGSPTIVTNEPIAFSKIESITISESGSCEIGYQLSNDGINYYFWDNSSWSAVSGDTDRNTKSDITSNIESYSTQFGAGNLYLRAFLDSDTSQSCSLNGIAIKDIE